MPENSTKPAETRELQLSAIRELIKWVRANGATQKVPQAVLIMAETTEKSLASNQDAPSIEVEAVVEQYFDAHGGAKPPIPAGNWLRRSAVTNWWGANRDSIAQACADVGLGLAPNLSSPQGGGRGNSSRYQFQFSGLDAFDLSETPDSEDEAQTNESQAAAVVRYQVDPAKPAWWAKGWWITPEGFPTRSWRGVLMLLIVLLGGLALVAMALCGALLLWLTPNYSPTIPILIAMAAAFAWLIWVEIRPLIRLPQERIVEAPAFLVSMDEFHAQLNLRKSAGRRVPVGWLHLSRHWGICPLCLGEVDVAAGTPTFPGRLVGRCADSPLEHVFVFDPVLLAGVHLLPNLSKP